MNAIHMYVTFLIFFGIVPSVSNHPIENNSNLKRHRRQLANLLSDVKRTEIYAKDNGVIIVANGAEAQQGASNGWLKSLKNGTSRLLGGATDLALLPVDWVTHMLDNWVFYLIAIIIILGFVVYFHRVCLNRNNDQQSMNFGLNLLSMMMPFRGPR